MITTVPLAKAYCLLNHGPVTLVTCGHAGQRNVMAAAWAMPLDFDPPKVAVGLIFGGGSFASTGDAFDVA